MLTVVFPFVLRQHERMKASSRSASRALSQLTRYPAQCLPCVLKMSSTTPARHHSTSITKCHNTVLRPLADQQLTSKQVLRSNRRHVSGFNGQLVFPQARRQFSVSTISFHNDLVPPKPGEEYVQKVESYVDSC